MMFSRILVANRGEIALRIIRACRELGIETVAVFSEADRNAFYLRQADYTICIGPGPAAKSYLDISRIISAAEITDVEAIHPGYGFLSENHHFAEVCDSCRIGFIGPRPEASRLVGNKANARALARKVGVPVLPGSEIVKDEHHALEVARQVGYPVMIKAAAGGGGRGMRVAHNDISLINSVLQAQAEAEAAFKDPSIFVERLVEKARHVEIQILGDTHGNIVHLGERDCSCQRRHQKLVEESPSPILTPKLRNEMGECAKAIAKAAKYTNAGTAEFLVDQQGKFFFLEMNARIQVEHPVTEMVTGVDLIKEQIKIAAGHKLEFKQADIQWRGAAIECRINAEDPERDFRPSPGVVSLCVPPGGPGVRLDSHIYTGYEIPSFYDSMIGKLIAHRATRAEAIATMQRALNEFRIEGVKTTIALQLQILQSRQFAAGAVDTTFVEQTLLK